MLNVIWGSNKDKPEAAKALAEKLSRDAFHADGYLYIGYPVMGSPLGPVKFDALLLSKQYGLIAIDLVEGVDIEGFKQRQDDIASMLDVKLKPYPNLKEGRKLKFEIHTLTFAPAKKNVPESEAPYLIANRENLLVEIEGCGALPDELFSHLLAAIQVVTTIRSGKLKREPKRTTSRAARLKRVEESIANLDQHQSRAVIETVEGVQRIRGLAGSGKTIVLALKVA